MDRRYVRITIAIAALWMVAGLGGWSQPTPGQSTQATGARSLPFVSPIFGDNMVLQRGKANTHVGLV